MEDIMRPLDAKSDGLVESMKDPTSAEGMIFFHADEGKPLATPWQVAISRAILLNQKSLPEGHILDCACGCLLYTSPSPRDGLLSRMPSSA